MSEKNTQEFELWSNLGKSLLILLGLYGLMMVADLLPDSIRYDRSAYMLIYCVIGILLILFLTFILKYRKLKKVHREEIDMIKADACHQQDHLVELNDIAEAVRREGYTPQKGEDDTTIFFNISGEPFQVRYEKGFFSIRRHYNLADDIDLEKLRKASVLAEEELFLAKIYVPTYEDGSSSIVFEIPLLITSAKEMYKLFPSCLHFLMNSIQRHRELYNELMALKEKVEDVSQAALGHENKFVS